MLRLRQITFVKPTILHVQFFANSQYTVVEPLYVAVVDLKGFMFGGFTVVGETDEIDVVVYMVDSLGFQKRYICW